MLTADQIARCWFRHHTVDPGYADAAIRRLEASRMIKRQVFEAHPLIRLTRPLLAWNPGEQNPTAEQFEKLAALSRDRWKKKQVPTEVFTATPISSRLFGAFFNVLGSRDCEATHDLHLSQVFMNYVTNDRRAMDKWWGEAAFPKLGLEIKGMKDPDAFVLGGSGQIERVVEFAGIYTAEHLATFHAHCAGQAARKIAARLPSLKTPILSRLYAKMGTSYELW